MHSARSRTAGLIALAAALATLVFMAFWSYQDWKQYGIASAEFDQVRQILSLNAHLLDLMRDAETGQRGFLLTGREEYLEPYNAAVEEIPRELVILETIVPSGSEQGARFQRLRSMINDQLGELQRTIVLRKAGAVAAALQIVETDRGKRTMDDIRQIAKAIEQAENLRSQSDWNDLVAAAQRLRLITIFGSLLLVGLVVSGGRGLNNAASQMERLIAELHDSRQSTEEAGNLLKATLYSIGDAVITTDRDGAVRNMNAVAERLTGYQEREVRGRPIKDVFQIVNEVTRRTVEDPVQRVLREGQVVGLANHTVLISKTGVDIPIDDSGAPIRGSDGTVSGVVLVFRDVSARKLAEETTQRLASIVHGSDDAIISKTLDGVVTSWNPGAERLFGYSAKEMIGSPISRLIPPDHADDIHQILDRIANGESVDHYQTERMTKDGRRLTVSLTVSPIRDDEGHIVGASKIARDITRERHLEGMLRQTQKMEAVGRLAGGIAHDFNNLLTVILGYSTVAFNTLASDDPNRKAVGEILLAAEKASTLTGQLLAFSRKQVTQVRLLDVNALIKETVNMLQRLIGEDIDLAVILDPGLSSVNADSGQLNQVLVNLAVNARDAMPKGGKLTIETHNVFRETEDVGNHGIPPGGHYAMIAITDTGIGMDRETQSHIFEPFFTTKESGKGTGLGLATVHGIVQKHGGWVDVYSELHHGATFKIYLPAAASVSTGEPQSVDQPLPRRTATILLVEDEAAIRMLLEDILSDAGHRVSSAVNGRAALQLIEQHPQQIDLLITDVVMPEMSGPELADQLSRSHPSMIVLYISGYTDSALLHRGAIEQGVAFLAKPFVPKSLLAKVDEMLHRNAATPHIS